MRTRTHVTALFLALCLLLGLAGCDTASTSPAATGATTSTRTLTDASGTSVTVPTHPKRIIAYSEPTTDALYALGLKPVGVVAGRGQRGVASYLADKAGDVAIMGTVAQPNYEAIGAAKPDLILVDGTSVNNQPKTMKLLRAIAPVVFTGYAGKDWRDNLRVTADAVGRTAQATRIIADYDQRAADLKARLHAAGMDTHTYSIVRWQIGAPSLILNELLSARALADVGLSRPANQNREGHGHSEPVSLENLAEIDADYLFLGTLGGSSVTNPKAGGDANVAAAKKAIDQAKQTPGFTSLHAYQAGHIIPVDGSVWTSTGGPLLMNRVLDDIETNLLKEK
ncbi:MAG: ABC transporter substrate-binding protein [Actinomycetaceae bacterium]|nr:ABC transporter substrate-binding protein [Actinomycetaceae bacterium]MDU0969795.1 ABC transporter substrate-binding protein [Actinomycetaceae bacterium]